MAAYSIYFKPSVQKDFRRLPASMARRLTQRIKKLTHEPFPSDAQKLSGAERLYRIRIGNYRAIYEVDKDAREITIHYVRHRRDAYRRL